MRRIVAAALAASLLATTAAMAQERGPVDVVRAVMQLELWSIAAVEPGGEGPLSEASLATNFTPEFWWALQGLDIREGEIGGPLLDGDPITGHQEHCPLRNLGFETSMGNDNVVLVVATFESQWCFPEAGTVAREMTATEFLLVRRDDGWRIEDFRTTNAIPNDDGTYTVRYVLPSFRQFIVRQLDENPAPALPPA